MIINIKHFSMSSTRKFIGRRYIPDNEFYIAQVGPPCDLIMSGRMMTIVSEPFQLRRLGRNGEEYTITVVILEYGSASRIVEFHERCLVDVSIPRSISEPDLRSVIKLVLSTSRDLSPEEIYEEEIDYVFREMIAPKNEQP